MRPRVYLDHNATAPLRSEARAAMIAAMDVVGNPSSVHAEGRAAKAIVERARSQVAAFIGAAPEQVVFTSGATEAAKLAMWDGGIRFAAPVEHDAFYAGTMPEQLDVGPDGMVLPDQSSFEYWAGRMHYGDVVVVQCANSETGIRNNVERQASGWRAAFGDSFAANPPRLVGDLTQMAGKVALSFAWTGLDMAVISGHKFGGPKGVGALLTRDEFRLTESPFAEGGGQETGRRSGTENVIGIAGFGAAAEAAQRDLQAGVWDRVADLRNILEKTIESTAKETIFVGKDQTRLPNTSCMATAGWKGETQVMQMDLAGFAISAGSACSSGKVRESRVLRAMGYNERVASSAIRVSLGPANTEDEVLRFAEAWLDRYHKFRARAA